MAAFRKNELNLQRVKSTGRGPEPLNEDANPYRCCRVHANTRRRFHADRLGQHTFLPKVSAVSMTVRKPQTNQTMTLYRLRGTRKSENSSRADAEVFGLVHVDRGCMPNYVFVGGAGVFVDMAMIYLLASPSLFASRMAHSNEA